MQYSAPREPPSGLVATLRHLGPSFILVGSVVGSGEIILTTTLGARVGFVMLWWMLLSCAGKSRVADEPRRAYLEEHLSAVSDARAAGVPVNGYFVWSFLDNFEWGHGFLQRFGIVHVDFATLQRTPKDSARWYSELLRARNAQHG